MTRLHASIWASVGSILPARDSALIEDAGWYQVITPSFKQALLNQVILSQVPTKDCERRVDATFRTYQELSLPFKWSIGPMSNTAIEPMIQSRAPDAWRLRGMAVDTSQDVACSGRISVERVDRRNFEAFLDVYSVGWGLEMHRSYESERLMAALSPSSTTRFYLARDHERPIGIAGCVVHDAYGYLISAVVLPEARGKGAYRALLNKRLVDLRTLGLSFAVTQAREATSAPILEAMGFATTFDGTIYRF